MSRFLYSLLFFMSIPAFAQISEEEKVRKAIDNICGDTWCEGDYSYRFKKVIFSEEKKQTQVNFSMSLSGWEPQVATSDVFTSQLQRTSFDVSCTINGYASGDEILSDPYVLKWDFYMAMSDCVQSLEHRLRNITQQLF